MAAEKDGRAGGRKVRVDFSIEQAKSGLTVHAHIPDLPEEDTPSIMPLNPRWTWLSPLAMRVVRLYCREGWLSREQVATALDEGPEGDLRPLLTDLAKRNILEAGKRGYHLAIPEDAAPEVYRKNLAKWLDEQPCDLPDKGN